MSIQMICDECGVFETIPHDSADNTLDGWMSTYDFVDVDGKLLCKECGEKGGE